jgi:hypothetical protein
MEGKIQNLINCQEIPKALQAGKGLSQPLHAFTSPLYSFWHVPVRDLIIMPGGRGPALELPHRKRGELELRPCHDIHSSE